MRYRIGQRVIISIALAVFVSNAHPPGPSSHNDPALASTRVQTRYNTYRPNKFEEPNYLGSLPQKTEPSPSPGYYDLTSIYSDLGFEECEKIDETKIDGVPYTILAKCVRSCGV
jgi:hypothetical protein